MCIHLNELKEWLDTNIDSLYIKVEIYVLEAVKRQMNSIFNEVLSSLVNVDGRTIASVFRSQVMIEQYKNSGFVFELS